MGVLEKLSPGDYHVTIVSAETYTTFTPLLPCKQLNFDFPNCSRFYGLPAAAVGTVQVRSLIEPIRKIIARLRGHFVQGKAIDVVFSEQLLEVEATNSDGGRDHFYVPCVPILFHDHLTESSIVMTNSSLLLGLHPALTAYPV